MKNLDLLRFHAALQGLRGSTTQLSGRFAVSAAYNARLIEPAVEAIKEAVSGPWDAELAAFEEDRVKLIHEHAERREDGTVKEIDGRIQPRDMGAWAEAFNELRAKHPGIDKAVADRDGRVHEVHQDEAPEINLRKVSEGDFPDSLTMDYAEALLPMVL